MTHQAELFEKCLPLKIFRALITRIVADTSIQQNNPVRSKESIFIYVVDDEPTLLELAEYILEMEGYKFEKFEEPKKAKILVFEFINNDQRDLSLAEIEPLFINDQK